MRSEKEIKGQLEDVKERLMTEADPKWFQGYANALAWVITLDEVKSQAGGEQQ